MVAQARQDFRVHLGFFRHVKTRRLRRRCGAEGVVSLLTLWAYAGENHHKGRLGDVSDEFIEECAEWTGSPGALAVELWDLVWIERHGRYGVVLHDWKHHQEFLYNRDKRMRRSQSANKAKRDKRLRRDLRGNRGGDPQGDRNPPPKDSPSSSSAPASSRSGGGANAPACSGEAAGSSPRCENCNTPVSLVDERGLCVACARGAA